MVKIPAFYVKRGVIAAGQYAGKNAVWISDQPVNGFTLHPAFKNNGSDLSQFWVGKYQASTQGNGWLASAPGVVPLVSETYQNFKTRAESRNANGVSGFGLWSIYQLSAIQTLALIEIGGSGSQALIGKGNFGALMSVSSPEVATATWRGIIGLWGNVFQMVDGLWTLGSQKYAIWDREGNKIIKTTAQSCPSAGWVVAMSEDIAQGYDLRDVYLPGVVDSYVANGTYGDMFSPGANGLALMGGGVSTADNGQQGLFMLTFSYDGSYGSPNVGSRLSKI